VSSGDAAIPVEASELISAKMRAGKLRWIAASSSLVFATSVGHAQTDDERAAARAAATEGVHAYEAGKYDETLDRFTRAEALVHAPPHLLYIARANVKLGRLVRAHEVYVKIVREALAPDAPRAFTEAHDAAVVEERALAGQIPELTVKLEGPGADAAQVTMDGVEVPSALVGMAHPVDPGQHVLVARSASAQSEPTKTTVLAGTKALVTLTLREGSAAPPPREAPAETAAGSTSSPKRTFAFVSLGVGAAGLVAGTLFMIKNRSDRGSANDLCSGPGGVCPAQKRDEIASLDSSANTAQTLAWIGYGVGVAGLAAGAILFFSSDAKSQTTATTTTIRAYAGPGALGVRGSF
jgi:hypothetical protein